MFPVQMDDIGVLQHRGLWNLERRVRDFGQDRPAGDRWLRLQKDGDTLRSARAGLATHLDGSASLG